MDVDPRDDIESSDAAPVVGTDVPEGGEFDLTPRTSAAHARSGSPNRRYAAIAVVVVLVGALGFVLYKGLDEASTFFYNVDEALEIRDELKGERFRMQGSVVEDSVEETPEGVTFVLAFNGETVEVDHTGTPPELFGPDIPVVVEGEFHDAVFMSDEILVKHDASYDEEHPERIRAAEDGGGQTVGSDDSDKSGSADQ
jgi:cytochrome c-type biogenesis protein CcmE